MMSKIKEYKNDDITVVWQYDKCIHSGKCVSGLPNVFRPEEQPWIKTDAAPTEELENQIKQCPSGALSFYTNDDSKAETQTDETKVDVLKNGPLLVHGTLCVTNTNGSIETKDKTTAFCRCGSSQNKPYCDGTHREANFEG